MPIEEARLARYAELVARLSRPLAAREAILWLARLGDVGSKALEAQCLAALEEDGEVAAAFGRAFARARALLDGEGDATEAQTREFQPGDLPVAGAGDGDLLSTGTVPIGSAAKPAASAVDLMDASFTLASRTQATRRGAGDDAPHGARARQER